MVCGDQWIRGVVGVYGQGIVDWILNKICVTAVFELDTANNA